MTSNSDEAPSRRAVNHLEGLGLSSYAARTFAGLVALGTGTAKEISDISEVPRTRVYDAADELAQRGLVTIEPSTPRRFHAVSIERAATILSAEYTDRIDKLLTDLASIEGADPPIQRADLWKLTDQSAIGDRLELLLDEADESLFFATARSSLDDAVIERLVAAAERGVIVVVAGAPQRRAARLERAGVDIERDPPWDPATLPIETVLIADDQRSLLTLDTAAPLAFWSVDEPNNLLVLLRTLLEMEQ